ncbi:hypothetical protein GCM10027347_60560 [Larkinella harenae]
MKRFVLLILTLLSRCMQAQEIDTIRVPLDGTSYLIFDEPISLVNLGTKAYLGKVEDRLLFVKALTDRAEPTTLLVQAGGTLFTGYLQFARKPKKNFYDYRQTGRLSAAPPSTPSKTAPATLTSSDLPFEAMKTLRMNTSVKQSSGGMVMECVQLFNDEQHTYIRFTVRNTTTIGYRVDLVSFTYKEKLARRLHNKVAPQYEEMAPVDRREPAHIEAGRSEDFYYALPLYSTTDKGFLEVIFREQVGARIVTVEIPSTKIKDAPLLTPSRP